MAIQLSKTFLKQVFGIFREELKNWKSYVLTSLGIGLAINFFSGNKLTAIASYIIPFFVQISRATANGYKKRHENILATLPQARKDPTFVMDSAGQVLLAGGYTKTIFSDKNVQNIKDVIDGDISLFIDGICTDSDQAPLEVYSPLFNAWYDVRVTTRELHNESRHADYLVWFTDITPRKEREFKIERLLQFSTELIDSERLVMENDTLFYELAKIIISGNFQAVFITQRNVQSGILEGWVYKRSINDGQVETSQLIKIDHTKNAPILLSQAMAEVIYVNRSPTQTKADFETQYPFNPHVKAFVGINIDNFVNYHSKDIAVIAFNKIGGVSVLDKSYMKALVNTARSTSNLVCLANQNEELFFQSVMGLCAAAEHCDEITGKHVLRVNEYARVIATHLGYDNKIVKTIGQVAALHDIGKIPIQDLIKFTGNYSATQRSEMEMHAIFGAHIIETMLSYSKHRDPRLELAKKIALNHHQMWNGQGYPKLERDGVIIDPTSQNIADYTSLNPLKGNAIPEPALIVSLADNYDALRSKRQYKPAFSHEKTAAILAQDDRTHFHGEDRFGPRVWAVFKDHHQKFDLIYERMRDDFGSASKDKN